MVSIPSFGTLTTPTVVVFIPTAVFVISKAGRSAPVVGLWPSGRSRRRDQGDQGRSQQHHAGLDFESGDCRLSFDLVFHFSAFLDYSFRFAPEYLVVFYCSFVLLALPALSGSGEQSGFERQESH